MITGVVADDALDWCVRRKWLVTMQPHLVSFSGQASLSVPFYFTARFTLCVAVINLSTSEKSYPDRWHLKKKLTYILL